MNRVVLILITFICAQTAIAQTSTPTSQPPAGQTERKKLTAEQLAELDEAARLSAKVVDLHKEQKYDEALVLANRVVEIRRRILGNYDGLTAAALINMAELHMAKREYGRARTVYEELLSIYEKTFGANHINNTIIIDSLALVNYLKGDHKKAEMFYMQSLAVRETAFGAKHADVAEAVYRLAEFYRSRGDYSKAEPLFLRAIKISDQVFGVQKPETQKFVQRYICFLYESKNVEDAGQLEDKLWESRFPSSARLTVEIMNRKAQRLPQPDYPAEASAIGASGVVRVEIKTDEQGRVTEAKALCGHPLLAKAAEDAARQARFSPATVGGVPKSIIRIIVYRFIRGGP